MHKRDGFCVRGRQRKVLDLIFTFITVAIIVISGVALLGQLAGFHLFSVESGSMTPEYPVDSLIIVREVEPESIQPGDVITFVARCRRNGSDTSGGIGRSCPADFYNKGRCQ